ASLFRVLPLNGSLAARHLGLLEDTLDASPRTTITGADLNPVGGSITDSLALTQLNGGKGGGGGLAQADRLLVGGVPRGAPPAPPHRGTPADPANYPVLPNRTADPARLISPGDKNDLKIAPVRPGEGFNRASVVFVAKAPTVTDPARFSWDPAQRRLEIAIDATTPPTAVEVKAAFDKNKSLSQIFRLEFEEETAPNTFVAHDGSGNVAIG